MVVKVLHCLETIGPGGVEQRRLTISKYLDKQQFEQRLTCSRVIGEFDKRLVEAGTTVEQLGVMGSPFNLTYYKRLLKVIRSFRPHIIHGAVFEGVISAVVGGLLGRVPIIIIEETSDPSNRSWRGHLLLRFLSRFADAVVAISPAVYDYLTVTLKIPASKTHLLVNGVEPPSQPDQEKINEVRRKFNLTKDQFVIGSVGRMFDDHKLFSVLIRAFATFSSGHPEARLLLVGDGVDRVKLEQLASDLGLRDNVIFAGHQSDLSSYYSIMNVFALVPAREGFGLASVEAMFFALPVIATRVGGLKQVVTHEETGLLLDPHQVEALSSAIAYLHAHPLVAAAMGQAGMKKAYEQYTSRRYVNDVNGLYQLLIRRKLQHI